LFLQGGDFTGECQSDLIVGFCEIVEKLPPKKPGKDLNRGEVLRVS